MLLWIPDLLLLGKGGDGEAGQHGKAEAAGDWLQDQADLVGKAAQLDLAEALAGIASSQQALSHAAAVRVVNKAELTEVLPARLLAVVGYYQTEGSRAKGSAAMLGCSGG